MGYNNAFSNIRPTKESEINPTLSVAATEPQEFRCRYNPSLLPSASI